MKYKITCTVVVSHLTTHPQAHPHTDTDTHTHTHTHTGTPTHKHTRARTHNTVVPRITSDPANEDFFRSFLDSANENGFG